MCSPYTDGNHRIEVNILLCASHYFYSASLTKFLPSPQWYTEFFSKDVPLQRIPQNMEGTWSEIVNSLQQLFDDQVDNDNVLRLGLHYLLQKSNRRQGQTEQVHTTDSLLAADEPALL